jgi:putative glutamine amidotransferase
MADVFRQEKSPYLRAPLIGISTSELRSPSRVDQTAEADPPRTELALGLSYPKAVERAGGIPLVVPPRLEAIEDLISRIDGLLLPGGPDLHPSAYGEEPSPALGPTDEALDDFELALCACADELGLPILAICRGQQLVNVLRGGTLVQDLKAGTIAHRQSEAGDLATHSVSLEPGTALARAFGLQELNVNSFHHQAIERLGRGLRPIAWAGDGLIEAVEATDRPFLLGVQWHAESLACEPDHGPLFRAFVEACRWGAAARRQAAEGQLAERPAIISASGRRRRGELPI